jgi:uncharacterized protein YndB with AHSA1/START domain
MAAITAERTINAPREAVFAQFTDLEHAPQRISGIDELEILTDGPVGVGTRFRETRTMFGKQATEVMEFVAFDRPASYELHAESCGSRYRTRFEFEDDAGGTRVRMHFHATPLTWPARIMGVITRPLFSGMLRRCIAQDLADLADACEGRSGG